MKKISRRSFVKSSSVALAGIMYNGNTPTLNAAGYQISFSTLGCPKWTFPEIVNFASKNGYNGIEIRGILGEMDLTKVPEFSNDQIAATMRMMEDKKLRFVDLGSSAEMHHTDPTERQNNIDQAKKFIDLAQKLNCPYIRVFPNKLPKEDKERKETMDLISKNLMELANYAKATNVTVLMETHGDAVVTNDLLTIMHQAENPHAGLVWDICNMWTITKEPPSMVYDKLKKYIRHTHVKDVKITPDGQIHYVLLGTGEAPLAEAIGALRKGNYNGFYSFEWEKLWHPEIAIAAFPEAIKKYFN